MGLTKTELFTKQQNELANIARCIAHPARIAILQFLLAKNTCINSSLVEEIGLAQPTISQHLKELKKAGLIKGTIEGKAINYCIDQKKWEFFQEELYKFFDGSIHNKNNQCC